MSKRIIHSTIGYVKKPSEPPESFAAMEKLCDEVIARLEKENADETKEHKRAPRKRKA